MSTRRDFFAFTAGAVVAKTVLPLAARAEPVQHLDAARSAGLILNPAGDEPGGTSIWPMRLP